MSQNPRFSDDNIAPLRQPDINKIRCRDCAYREADRMGGKIEGATLGICDMWGIKPYEIVWKNADCKYYEKEDVETEDDTADDEQLEESHEQR